MKSLSLSARRVGVLVTLSALLASSGLVVPASTAHAAGPDTSSNKILPFTHADFAPHLDDNGDLRMDFHEKWYTDDGERVDKFSDFANTIVVVPDNDKTRWTVPNTSWRFLAEPGSTIWRLPADSHSWEHVWLGYSAEDLPPEGYWERALNWRLDAVTSPDGGPAPGHFFLGTDLPDVSKGRLPLFDSRRGTPQSVEFISRYNAHVHAAWDFTEKGTYCLTFNFSGTRASDGAVQSTTRTMTVVVGDNDVDPTSMQTCEQAQGDAPPPSGTPSGDPADRTSDPGTVSLAPPAGKGGSATLTPTVDGGRLAVSIVRDSQLNAGNAYHIDRAVFPVVDDGDSSTRPAVADHWEGRDWRITAGSGIVGEPYLGLSLDRLSSNQVDGPVTWAIGDVRGPGEMVVSTRAATVYGQDPVFSTVAGSERISYQLWPQTASTPNWHFQTKGVYCVPMTWTAKVGGAEQSVSRTLAFAVGVDPATVNRNDGGCVATEPDPGPDPDPDPEPGPDDLLDSGRAVISRGHVDILSTVDSDAVTQTIHDDSVSPAVERKIAETTLQVVADAKTAVPEDSAYSFLGKAGDPVWLLPQRQQDGLLWPGWNVVPGASTGTGQAVVTWTLGEVSGPGDFALYVSDGFGDVDVLLDSDDPDNRSFTFDQHGHGNWAFSQDGAYCVPITATEAATGHSANFTLLYAVGDMPAKRVTEADCGKTAAELNAPAVLPTIVNQPTDVSVAAGQEAMFVSVSTDGDPLPIMRWQSKTAGGEWGDLIVPTGTTSMAKMIGGWLTLPAVTMEQSGTQYRAVYINTAGRVTTDAATLTVTEPVPEPAAPQVTAQPADTSVIAGQKASFVAAATGEPVPTVQWEAKPAGGEWKPVANATDTTLTLSDVTVKQSGTQYRAVFTNESGSITTDAAKLTVTEKPTPRPDPKPAATKVTAKTVAQTYGKTAKLTVAVSPTKASGKVTVKVGSKTVTGTLSKGKVTVKLPAKALKPGTRSVSISYAGVKGKFKPASATAKVKVAKAKPQVKVKRAKTTVKRGTTATFTVTVTGTGVKPTGKVTVTVAGQKKTVKLSSKGKATVKVKLSKKTTPGKKTVTVTYGGDTYVAKGKTSTKLAVKR